MPRTQQIIVWIAETTLVNFHRADDASISIKEASEILINIGAKVVLTLAAYQNVKDGFQEIKIFHLLSRKQNAILPCEGVKSASQNLLV